MGDEQHEGELAGKPADVVRAGYDRLGARYHAWGPENPVRRRFLREALDRLSPGSDVIELGCGPGDPVTRALAAAHDVLAVDISPGQLRLAREAAPTARFLAADMTELRLPPASADAVVSFYALGHVPPEAHRPLLEEIASWLRPGGFLLASTPLSTAQGVQRDWLGVPMYFGGIGRAATLEALEGAGLQVERADVVDEDEGDQVVQFLWVTARRAGR
jgi:SAM-dependent methyltransferase